ncbi:FGGY-family carbohydrate kinase [Actinobaculum sp. 313]|uniref:FGGY-family carbohydrate kinase n=1 Tax=Actinobaculum sp. 313 TaxID=2495645 RepID=UPI00196B5FDC|nr:FGGY-family carbohydrate kinase [Actinobaculum sp. 313]
MTEEADTPVFLPFLFGERCPGWNDERRGGFLNVEASHTANDLYRAAQEGVLFNLYQCYKVLAEANGAPTEVMLSGGILKSSAWTQMAADIFGVPMSVNDVEQGSLLGAIILGMEQQGLIDDVRDYKPTVVRTIDPDPSHRDFYEEKFARYLECYENNC